jgi:hypothetical protein
MPAAANWQPTFIGIGAAKCATTWCWDALRQHPQIDAGQPKEIDFFRLHYDRGVAWYARHFRHADRPVRGEMTPLYMDDPYVAERIRGTFPHVKLLVVLRNPFDRALSNLLHDTRDRDGGVADASLQRARALAADEPKFLRRSLYAQQLRPFVERFAVEQFAVLLYDDLVRDPRGFLRQLYAAVGADAEFTPRRWDEPVNRTRDYRWPTAFRALQTASRAAHALPPTRAAMHWLYRRTSLREWTLARLGVDRGQPRFDFAEVFGSAAVEAIKSDVAELQSMFNLPLPIGWREATHHARAA